MTAKIILQKIIDNCQKNNPNCNIELIQDAYDFAAQAHQGQKRVSGEDYIFHLLATAETLANLHVDSKTIAAALLHDVLDDCSISEKELEKTEKELENLIQQAPNLPLDEVPEGKDEKDTTTFESKPIKLEKPGKLKIGIIKLAGIDKKINELFKKNNINGKARSFNLINDLSNLPKVDLCMILKVLESLESIKKNFSKELLKKIKSKIIIVSFAKIALGKNIRIKKAGRSWFRRILKELNYNYYIKDYDDEIFFVIKKL